MITRVSADLGELAAYGGPSSDRAYRDDLRVVRVPSVTGPSPFGRAAARGFDVNASLSYSVFVTASGKQIGTIIESPTWNDGFIIADFRVPAGAGLSARPTQAPSRSNAASAALRRSP